MSCLFTDTDCVFLHLFFRLVYVSCNPATQARDLALLCGAQTPPNKAQSSLSRRQEEGRGAGASRSGIVGATRESTTPPAFHLLSLQVVDMFPHTDHAETVAVLERSL